MSDMSVLGEKKSHILFIESLMSYSILFIIQEHDVKISNDVLNYYFLTLQVQSLLTMTCCVN